jgi:hypothetical protein
VAYSQVGSEDVLKYTPEYDLKYASNSLNYTFQACLTLCSQVSSQVASKYTPSMFPGVPPRTFSSTLQSMLSTTLLIAHDGILAAI